MNNETRPQTLQKQNYLYTKLTYSASIPGVVLPGVALPSDPSSFELPTNSITTENT